MRNPRQAELGTVGDRTLGPDAPIAVSRAAEGVNILRARRRIVGFPAPVHRLQCVSSAPTVPRLANGFANGAEPAEIGQPNAVGRQPEARGCK